MRTIAYVDGYNLYHGRLKHTPFKWLDLVGLVTSIANRSFSVPMIPTWCPPSNSTEAVVLASPLVFVMPRPQELHARKSRMLQDLAHWTRDHILDSELTANQFPKRVPTAGKPAHW